jgi:general secretion pathway protein L
MILLLLAPHPTDQPHWQRRAGARIIAQGQGLPPADPAVPLIVAVPGEAVALHWLDLPELAPAQAAAAARLLLGDRLAEADPHISIAAGSGPRPVAVVARAAMAGWLAELAGAGLTPNRAGARTAAAASTCNWLRRSAQRQPGRCPQQR